ncbi:MAG: hypothetical protein EA384_16145 [Spirochaetaceae bacterium]|nr:MAG: hypothetical protein EA384_16145 [Spirochaetaceae bacterium]
MAATEFYPDRSIGLRNHIPLGAPATREPVDGSEGFLRVSLGFTPAWYRSRLGIDFSEVWHTDPVYRARCLLTMKQHLHAAFPGFEHFTPRYENGVERSCWTISGVYGILLMARLYGIEPQYAVDKWPDARDGAHIPREEIAIHRPLDLEDHPVLQDLYRQMRLISEHSGPIHGYLNYQGLLNVALKVRGNDIFTDFFDHPDWLRRFLQHIAGTITAVSRRVQAMQRESGFPVDLLSMSNCVMNMVSPQQYEQFVLPFDRQLGVQYARFGVHTCNWKADPYLDSLRRIERMGYLDTGIETDLARMRILFPDTRRAVLYDPVALEQKTAQALDADFRRIARECGPCDIVLADIDASTTDERVRDALALAAELDVEFS